VAAQDAALLQRATMLLVGAKADSTWASYVPAWQRFVAFCTAPGRGYRPLPAASVHVALFLTEMGSAATSYATVKLASAAINAMHELVGVPSPTKDQHCKMLRRSFKRTLGLRATHRKEPLSLDVCAAAVRLLLGPPGPTPLWARMLAAFIMVCFAGFLRYQDAAVVRRKDVRVLPSHAEIFLCVRKNDQFREGNVVLLARGSSDVCPVLLLERFLEASEYLDLEGPLFVDFDGHGAKAGGEAALRGTPLPYERARYHVLKWVAKAAGVSQDVAVRSFGLHSLRSGGATSAAVAGVQERAFQAHGGWRSRESMLVYLKEPIEQRLAVTRALGY
jgi:integrase